MIPAVGILSFPQHNISQWVRDCTLSRLQVHTQPQSVIFLCTSDQPNAQTSNCQHTTLITHKTDIHPFGGTRTRNPSQRAAAGPGLRPRGHWNRPTVVMVTSNKQRNLYLIREILEVFSLWCHTFLPRSTCVLLCESKSRDEIVPVHGMKAYRGVQVQLHSFLNSALDRGQGSISRFGRFISGERNAVPIEQETGLAPQPERSTISILLRKKTLDRPVHTPVIPAQD